jgi:SAM-dependent methyltransferase
MQICARYSSVEYRHLGDARKNVIIGFVVEFDLPQYRGVAIVGRADLTPIRNTDEERLVFSEPATVIREKMKTTFRAWVSGDVLARVAQPGGQASGFPELSFASPTDFSIEHAGEAPTVASTVDGLVHAPYGDDATVTAVTSDVLARGCRLFQIHRLASDDQAHVAALLSLFAPPQGALVLDAGCGIGAMAALMAELRPDLRFVLLNVSPGQLRLAPRGFTRVAADFHDLPLRDGTVGAVLFAYSLGHGLLERVMAEAARVLRPGGVLFIYDLAAEDSGSLITRAGYKAHPRAAVETCGRRCGLGLDLSFSPAETNVSQFVGIVGEEEYWSTFSAARPVAYRFSKPEFSALARVAQELNLA